MQDPDRSKMEFCSTKAIICLTAVTCAPTGDWGELQGADAAAMVEVVEHLDPEALAAAGPALLGGLRPNIAIVTTPNIEYNSVCLFFLASQCSSSPRCACCLKIEADLALLMGCIQELPLWLRQTVSIAQCTSLLMIVQSK